MDWYLSSVLALAFMGIQRFLYKVSAERRCNTAWAAFSFMGTVTVLSGLFFAVSRGTIRDAPVLLMIALVNSASFLAGTVTHIEALKRVSVVTAYAIIRLNVVLVVLFSVLYFGDRLSRAQSLGVFLAFGVIVLLTRAGERPDGPRSGAKRGLILVFASLFAGAVASVSSKFAAMHTDPLAFMALSYALSSLGALALRRAVNPEEPGQRRGAALRLGLCMGLANFAGYYLFLRALSAGPLSVVVSVTSLHFVISIVLSAVIYRERMTVLKGLGVLATVAAVLLMRL